MNPYIIYEKNSQSHRINRSCPNYFTETDNFWFLEKKEEKKYEFTVQKPEEIECSSLRQSKDMIKS